MTRKFGRQGLKRRQGEAFGEFEHTGSSGGRRRIFSPRRFCKARGARGNSEPPPRPALSPSRIRPSLCFGFLAWAFATRPQGTQALLRLRVAGLSHPVGPSAGLAARPCLQGSHSLSPAAWSADSRVSRERAEPTSFFPPAESCFSGSF